MNIYRIQEILEKRGFKFKIISDVFDGQKEIRLKKDEEETKMVLYKNKVIIEPCKNQTSKIVMILLKEIEEELQKTDAEEIRIVGEKSFVTDTEYINLNGALEKELKRSHPIITFAKKIRNVIQESVEKLHHGSFKMDYYPRYEEPLQVRIKTFYQEYRVDFKEIGSDEIFFVCEDKEFACSYEECRTHLKETLEKREGIQRIQSVFQKRPHPYLSELLEETYEVPDVGEGMVQTISEKLLKHYKYEEIEEIAKEKRETKEVKIIYKRGSHYGAMIPFGKTYIVIYDRKVDAGIEKEAYIETLEKKVAEWAFGNKKAAALRNL